MSNSKNWNMAGFSEMLLLSSGVLETCGLESKHETKLIIWPLFLLWALHVELTVSSA